MVPQLSMLSLALCTKMLFRGMYLHNETKIRKRRAAGQVTNHREQRYEPISGTDLCFFGVGDAV